VTRNIRTLVDSLSFAEAPRWRSGALYMADMHANRVLCVGSDGKVDVVAKLDGPVSGIGWLPDGRLLVVSMNDRRLMRQELDGRVVLHGDLNEVADWHANDMAVAADGTAYVGNFGFSLHPPGDFRSTSLAMIRPDGTVTAAADELWFPNGIAISDDGRTLIVAESGAFRLTAFDIASDGILSNRRVWAQLEAGQSPDGICLDADGAVWVALPTQRAFIRVREGGEVVETITIPLIALACVLGGPERRTLFMMSSAHTDPADCRAHLTGTVTATEVEVGGVGFP
jgi:sugar lactone lactonase YvrE